MSSSHILLTIDPLEGPLTPRTTVAGLPVPAKVVILQPGQACRLHIPAASEPNGHTQLRLGLNTDVFLGQTLQFEDAQGKVLGSGNLSMMFPLETLVWDLPQGLPPTIWQGGLVVRLVGGTQPLELFAPGSQVVDQLLPHLFTSTSQAPLEAFLERMADPKLLCGFGWMSGCVLDGLASLAASNAPGNRFQHNLDRLLDFYFPETNGAETDGSVEGTVSLAQLVMSNPQHPAIARTLEFFEAKRRSGTTGMISDGNQTAAEGNYSVAYPLAMMSKVLGRPDLAQQSIAELRFRRDKLVDTQGRLYLRHHQGDSPEHSFRFWSRGMAWYLLGLARSLDLLDSPPQDLVEEFQRAATVLMAYQNPAGFWRVFLDDEACAPESSGTAGMGAALMIGSRHGWVGASARQAAEKALEWLIGNLTPDGLLPGTAHANKLSEVIGDRFQRTTKGTINPFGMGLMAQLVGEFTSMFVK